MVRNYKKKGSYGTYKPEVIEAAVAAVKSNLMTIRKAAKEFGIPPTTLHNWVEQKVKAGNIGRPATLPSNLENKIVETAQTAAEMGFGLSRKQLLIKTGKMVKSLRLKTPFKKGVPGKDWFQGLKGRHPELSIKKPQKLSVVRARAMNRRTVGHYFQLLKNNIDKDNLQPEHIWNCDETNMQLEHKPAQVVGRKGRKYPGRVANSKESVSVLGCGNAAGDIMSPMVIVKGKTPRSLQGWKTEDAPPQTKWAYQPKSYMDQCLGLEWFQKVFLAECGTARPQLLIVDSHCSHEPVEMLELAKQENIIIQSLPSHCTHYLQPWDVSMFAPLKKKYNAECSDFMVDSVGHNITKQTWPGIFCKAWTSAISAVNMRSGFASTGIHPFNPNAIPNRAFAPSTNHAPSVQAPSNAPNIHPEGVSVDTAPLEGATVAIADVSAQITPQPDIQCEQIVVSAEIHPVPSIAGTPPSTNITLDFPVMGSNGIQTLILPVSFDGEDKLVVSGDTPDLGNVQLVELDRGYLDLPNEIWNSEVEAMFLPKTDKAVVSGKKRSSASASRILTSSEIIQAKKEKVELKEQKAKAAQERKARALERKKKAEEKKLARLLKKETKK